MVKVEVLKQGKIFNYQKIRTSFLQMTPFHLERVDVVALTLAHCSLITWGMRIMQELSIEKQKIPQQKMISTNFNLLLKLL